MLLCTLPLNISLNNIKVKVGRNAARHIEALPLAQLEQSSANVEWQKETMTLAAG
jgi:hypothetical protein